jgi:prepilin-type N-terminal cleavage/methylation domain-containing protein
MRHGYTMIEVMMGLAILAVGATGVIALQKTAALGSVTSRHLANATTVSRNVIEEAEAEAMTWTDNTSNFGPAVGWLRPGLESSDNNPDPPWYTTVDSRFSINLELLPVVPLPPPNDTPVAYCSHVRVSWLGRKTPAAPAVESTAVRFEVRTLFSRTPRDIRDECAADPQDITDLLDGTSDFAGRTRDEYGAVYLTTVIRRGT